MIDFEKIEGKDLQEIKKVIMKNVEKSDLERFFLFTTDSVEKGRVFTLCYRLLLNLHNLLETGNTRDKIKEEIEKLQNKYLSIVGLLEKYDGGVDFGKDIIKSKIFSEVNKDEDVNGLIDTFSVLVERVDIIQISKLKGFALEGKSGQEFKKVFPEGL